LLYDVNDYVTTTWFLSIVDRSTTKMSSLRDSQA
jgi:hypothetical protein